MNIKGFTLLEILIVFAIIAILSLVGIASFISFNRSQILNVATSDFVGALNLAKSRTLSQVKPCTGNFKGYKVGICPGGCGGSNTYDYAVYAICEISPPVPDTLILGKKLPETFSLTPSPPEANSFLFRVLTGAVEIYEGANSAVVTINGYDSNSKTVTIYSDGRINTN